MVSPVAVVNTVELKPGVVLVLVLAVDLVVIVLLVVLLLGDDKDI